MVFVVLCNAQLVADTLPPSLSNAIHVTDKVSARGVISLNGGAGGIFIGDKVSASGSIDITGGRIEILGSMKASGAIRISSHGKGEEERDARKKSNMEGGYGREGRKCVLNFGGKIEGSSLSIEGDVEVIGDLYSSRTLKLKGNLRVSGDLEVKGDLVMRKGDTVVVSGKRTVHGSIREV
ncbi:uncharacterized protein RCO7_09594 [Rhynchosporium graminicola]|uniref:Polymer-forming cytoskeletal protein n=1 Tax=Rhynchosporium graminicola TaxID=2792576 RepID=A0A1E1LC87_9HELO|nr:uncharacterized protein RCO7_09594 [Rhynchosporium commune]